MVDWDAVRMFAFAPGPVVHRLGFGGARLAALGIWLREDEVRKLSSPNPS